MRGYDLKALYCQLLRGRLAVFVTSLEAIRRSWHPPAQKERIEMATTKTKKVFVIRRLIEVYDSCSGQYLMEASYLRDHSDWDEPDETHDLQGASRFATRRKAQARINATDMWQVLEASVSVEGTCQLA
jgi:hypothetical protein